MWEGLQWVPTLHKHLASSSSAEAAGGPSFRVVVYNKGEPLPPADAAAVAVPYVVVRTLRNVAREDFCYLHHVIHHAIPSPGAKVVMFSQAQPWYHVEPRTRGSMIRRGAAGGVETLLKLWPKCESCRDRLSLPKLTSAEEHTVIGERYSEDVSGLLTKPPMTCGLRLFGAPCFGGKGKSFGCNTADTGRCSVQENGCPFHIGIGWGLHLNVSHEEVFEKPPPPGLFPFYFAPGAYFAVSRQRISARPLSFYTRLIALLEAKDDETRAAAKAKGKGGKKGLTVASELGFALERFWPIIFGDGEDC